MLERVIFPITSNMSVSTFSPKRAPVIEIVGPAGVGKSTLLRLLSHRDKRIRTCLRLSPAQYMKEALLLQPTFFRIHNPYRRVLWKEMKRILYLHVLHEVIHQQASKSDQAIVLDEGPIYMLSRLRVFGGDVIESSSFQRWWKTAIRQWASVIDTIVWLDAQNPILAHRIRTREQPCPINETTDSAMFKFLGRYRAAFDKVITELTAVTGPRVMRFITDQESLEQIADRILLESAEI